MATAKKTQIVITANAATAKKVMDELQQRIEQIKTKMATLDVTTKQGAKEFNKLNKELVSYNATMVQNVTNEERVKNAIDNLSRTSLNELKRALSSAKAVLGKTFADDPNLKKRQQDVKTLQDQIDKLTGSTKRQGTAWQTAAKNLTAYVGMFAVFNKAKELMTGVIKKNLDYSASLTDIRKVSGLTMKDINTLSGEMAKIDTRTSMEGLAKLAYEGAKLGMSDYGVEGMAGFVRAADQINVAIGEEMGEEALPAMAKMVETMGLIPKLGIEKAMLATGSAMFRLASSSTATAGNIVEFAKRLTGVSRTAGITTDQLLALGSASDSMFLMPEVASTAMSKFIVALQKNHNLIEKDLGIQQGTIKQMYAAGNAIDAIVLVLEKMRDKGNMNALGGIFNDLGSNGQRLIAAMVTMSKNVDMLKGHLYESKEAFDEATAVTNEYQMQQTSALGILERANNLWEKAFVNPEGVNNVKDLTQAWYDVSQMILNSPIYNGTLHAAFKSVTAAAKMFVVLLPLIINYLISAGIAKGLSMLWEMSKAIYGAVTAQKALNAAVKVNPWVALASVVMTVVGVIWSCVNASREAAKAQEEAERKANAWKDRLKEAERETDTLTRRLHSYKVALEQANLSQAERNGQISRFNKDFRQYISKLGIEIKSVSDLKRHYSELSTEIQRATYYRLREQAKEDAMPSLQKDRLAAANALKKEIESVNALGSSFTPKSVMAMFGKGANSEWVYRQMVKGMETNVGSNGIKFGKDGSYSYTDKDGSKISSKGYKELLSALRWYYNATNRETTKEKEINDYFSPFVPENYTPWQDDNPGTLENDAPDKKAAAEAKRQKNEQKRSWRDDLKQAQDEAKAVMDDVRNFYERQINAKLSEAVSLGMDKTEQDLFVEPVKLRMNEALKNVRLAIAEQKNNWEEFKDTMGEDLVEKDDDTGVNLSKGLLKNIQGNNISALSAKMRGLSASLNKPYNSTIAEIFAKATKNEQSNISLEAKQAEARRKESQEYDYTGTVQQKMYDDFNTMGYANPTSLETSCKLLFDKRKAAILSMYEKARTEITSLYKIDVSTTEGQGALLQLLFGDNPDGIGSRVASVLGDSVGDWRVFYLKLIQYSDEYTVALKKEADERKKVYDFLWDRTGMQASQDSRSNQLSQVNKGTERFRKAGQGKDSTAPRSGLMGGSAFMEQFSYNGDLEQGKQEILLLQEKINWLQQYGATSEQIAEQQSKLQQKQDAYITTLMTVMNNRANALYEILSPLDDFGTSVGSAFAEMTEDAEKGRDSLKAAVGDMIKTMMKQTVQMTQEYVKRRIMQKVNDKLVSKQIKKSTKEQTGLEEEGTEAQTGIQEAAGDAKVLLTQSVGDQVTRAVAKQTQTTTQTSQAAAVTDVQTQAAKTQANVGLGIAEGGAKTIGKLGWWGIPLIAVISAALNALLSLAMSKVSSLFGGGSSSDTSSANVKIKSGMLTYDSGNVQDLKPFVTNNGEVYWASESSLPSSGTALLTSPTATAINGLPSLVAEKGPELVIGRETTKAMMMNNPALLKALVNYDANYSGRRAYDQGNIAEILGGITVNGASDTALNNSAAANVALMQVANQLLQRLQEPIKANINMYGTGGMYERMQQANQFMKGKNR